jgi:hypothetical protein
MSTIKNVHCLEPSGACTIKFLMAVIVAVSFANVIHVVPFLIFEGKDGVYQSGAPHGYPL